MELRDYLRILRKGWVLILVFTLLGVAAAAAYSVVKTPEYESSAKVFVSTQSSGTVQELAQGNTFTQQRVTTYASLVTTPIVLLPVIARLGLDSTAQQLATQIEASAPLNTTLIQITATTTSPTRSADVANAAAESLTQVVRQIEMTSDSADVSPVKLTRVQDATVPLVPVTPNIPLNIALGLLVGLALGVGLAVLRDVLDTRIRNIHDVEQTGKGPIVGGISFDSKARERPLIVHVDPRSPRAESFRTLRTNLQFIDIEGAPRSFVVTSSVGGEGKSTTAANLAITLADAGSRVLLVDADLRRPKVMDYMGLEGTVGLTDLLISKAPLSDVLQRWGRGDLYVLTAGQVPPNPSELLGSKAMAHMIKTFEAEFEYIIFDSPPLLPVTDAAILSKSTGGVLMVVAAGRTRKNQLSAAITALQNVGSTASGFVLTMMPTKGPDSYGYNSYGYSYSYGGLTQGGRRRSRKRTAVRRRTSSV